MDEMAGRPEGRPDARRMNFTNRGKRRLKCSGEWRSAQQRCAAVDEDLHARDVAAHIRGEEEAGVSYFEGITLPLVDRWAPFRQLDLDPDFLHVPLLGSLTDVRLDRPWAYGVAADVVPAQFQCDHLHEGNLSGLGRAVGAGAGVREGPGAVHAAGNNDAAAAGLFEVWHREVDRQIGPLEVDIQRAIPFVGLQLVDRRPYPVDARVRKDDVELPEVLDGRIDRVLHGLRIAHVALHIDGLIPGLLEFGPDVLTLLRHHVRERDLSSLLRKAPRRAFADTARRARNKGYLAVQHAHVLVILSILHGRAEGAGTPSAAVLVHMTKGLPWATCVPGSAHRASLTRTRAPACRAACSTLASALHRRRRRDGAVAP